MKHKNKVKALYILFSVLFVWGGVMTFAYWRLAKSSTDYLETQQSRSSPELKESLESTEVTFFLKRLLESHFSYNKDNYKESRQQIANLLSEELRGSFLQEAHRLYPRIRDRNIHYKGEVKNLILHKSGKFGALIEVQLISENAQRVFYSTTGQWARVTRSLENPSGIYLKEWSHNQAPYSLSSKDILLEVTPGITVTLHFPCPLKNTSKSSSAVSISVTTTESFSEARLTLSENLPMESLVFTCGKTQFSVLLKSSSESYYTFMKVHNEEGRRIVKVADEYDRVIDKVLGKSGL